MSSYSSPFSSVFTPPFNSPYQPGAGGAWSPALLFLASEQGIWLDPSDMSTLFQDAAGTTPVTAVEQPVGLILDKRLGLALGSELITNGDFTTNTTGWDASNVTLAAVGGELEVTASSGASEFGAPQAITCVIGRTYHVTLTMRAGASNSVANACRIRVSTSSTGGTISYQQAVSGTAPTPVSAMFVATATTHYIQLNVASLIAWGALGDKAYFDNVSIRELSGNHASQATAASRPVLKETGTVRRINFDGVDDKLTTTFPDLGSNATIAQSVPGVGASILTGQTIGAGAWDDSTNHCGLVIVNRALTGPETASLTAYLNELAGV